jgi:hypothetical protein
MTVRHIRVRGSALALAGIVLVGLASAGCGAVASAAAPGSPSAAGSVRAPTSGGTTDPPILPITGISASGGAAGPSSGYPVLGYQGLPGLAPDHTIVVTSTSQAAVEGDFSNRVAAQHAALTAALADSRAQADIVAAATGSGIRGVLSVNVTTSQNFPGPVPAGVVTGPAPSRGAPQSIQPFPSFQMIAVTVTVAYSID